MNKSKISSMMLVVIIFCQNIPLIWIFIASIRKEMGLFTLKDIDFTVSNFIHLFSDVNFLNWVWNSLFVSILAAVIATICGVLFSFNLQFFVPEFFNKLKGLVLIAYLIPSMFLVLSIQQVIDYISGWLTLVALSFCYQFFLLPVSIWLSNSYISHIPRSLIAIACLEDIGISTRIKLLLIPYVGKGIFAIFTLCFVMAFQEYLYSLVFLKSEDLFTIPVGLTSLQAGDVFNWGVIASGAIAIVFFILITLFLVGNRLGSAMQNLIERS